MDRMAASPKPRSRRYSNVPPPPTWRWSRTWWAFPLSPLFTPSHPLPLLLHPSSSRSHHSSQLTSSSSLSRPSPSQPPASSHIWSCKQTCGHHFSPYSPLSTHPSPCSTHMKMVGSFPFFPTTPPPTKHHPPRLPHPLLPSASSLSISPLHEPTLQIVLQRLEAGSYFGADCFLLEIPYRTDLVAMQLCECMLLGRAAYDDLMQRFPDNSERIKAAATKLHK